MKSLDLSIVIPIYNEQDNIKPLLTQLNSVLKRLKLKHEIICVDDGSGDNSWTELLNQARTNKHLKLVRLRRNFGQTAALSAGFDVASGQVIVTLDGDLQNDPRNIPLLLLKLNQGFDVVSGWRRERHDDPVRVWLSRLANKIISVLSGVPLHDFGCTLKAYRAEIVKELRLYGEMHRFIPALAVRIGARVAEVPVDHHPRRFGQSKYGLDRTFRVILDVLMIKFLMDFQTRPLHLFGSLGLGLGLVGSGIFSFLVYEKLFLSATLSNRPLFLVSVFLVLVGIQLITIGILAEMLMRIYYEAQDKRPYYIKEIHT